MPTTNYGWILPTPGGSTGVWGVATAGGLNYTFQQIDTEVKRVEGIAGAGASSIEQPLILPGIGNSVHLTNPSLGLEWVSVGAFGVVEDASINLGNSPLIVPLPHLRSGQRITGFKTYGGATGLRVATVQLFFLSSNASVTPVAGTHTISLVAGIAQTTGLTQDVLADQAYFLAVTPTGGTLFTDGTQVNWVQLIVSLTP